MTYIQTNRSSMHGIGTPHGMKIKHRFPILDSNSFTLKLSDLIIQLYPTGRAWGLQKGGVFYNLHEAINRSFIRFIDSCKSFLDSHFPDNDNFNADDCLLWEYRLGLTTNLLLDVPTRKQAILRKMAFPGNIKPRQSLIYIESQLQLVGFNVWLHENTIPYRTPGDIVAIGLQSTQHGGSTQHGEGTQHGSLGFDIIANLTTPNETFSVGGNLWATFFIGGENLGDVALVPENRLLEFKELVLKLKPAHLVAYTFINYV